MLFSGVSLSILVIILSVYVVSEVDLSACHCVCSVLRSLLLCCGPLLTANHLSVRNAVYVSVLYRTFLLSLHKGNRC